MQKGYAMRKTAGWLAVAVSVVGGFEGLRQSAYLDPVSIPTICYGETRGVKLGDTKTKDECDAMLMQRLMDFEREVSRCVSVPMNDSLRVATVSLAYNIGHVAFCKSSLVKRLNVGDRAGACDEFLKWDKARVGGVLVTLPGLAKRRMKERELCLQAD